MSDLPDFQTPMMKQYTQIKREYSDAILFFRLGDFYEMFLEDAKIGADVLGITLTARNKGKDGDIPMCGVPYHAAEGYIQKLVRSGYKVAVCEQITEPTPGKEIVERDVIRVVTPSTLLTDFDDMELARDFLMSFSYDAKSLGYALISPKSGEVLVAETVVSTKNPDTMVILLEELIQRFKPAELLVEPNFYDTPQLIRRIIQTGVFPFRYSQKTSGLVEAKASILTHYRIDSLESIGIQEHKVGIIALASGISYLRETQKSDVQYLKPPRIITEEGVLHIPSQTFRNLEIFQTMRDLDRDTSLFNVVNNTYTSMGMRLLQQWLLRPITIEQELNKRYDAVGWFINNQEVRTRAVEILSQINDIERIVGRVSIGIANGRDAISLMASLNQVQQLTEITNGTWPSLISEMFEKVQWHNIEELTAMLKRALGDNPPVSINEGGIIRDGFSEELDELRKLARGGKEWLTELELRERVQTGIQSLKIGYNKVFGYYIEVSHANTEKVPPYFIRRQTLANAERYITPELKEHEEMVLEAQARIFELEYQLFRDVLGRIVEKVTDIQNIASFTAMVDVLVSFAETASMNSYTRPEITKEYGLEIYNGRHPVVGLMSSNAFVPNDTKLDSTNRMMIITGANMAGKSTYIRQVALLVIMAQSGSFVPAERMRFGLFDQIHTRIGAMDNLVAGLSTFMVEMVETAYILNNVNDRSLVVLDEIGRGTSTYDGLSIAWSVAEHLIQNTKGYVLFATHYHELTELSDMYETIKNYHMAVTEQEQDLIFLYRIAEGSASQSYGIEVAKRAGIPVGVIKRSRVILANLTAQARAISPLAGKQLDLFGRDISDND